MGLKLGRFLKKTVRSLAKRAPGIVTGFISGGPTSALLAAVAPSARVTGAAGPAPRFRHFMPGQPPLVQEEFPGQFGGPLMVEPVAAPAEAGVPAVVAGLSSAVIRAITVIGSVLGIRVSALNITRVGMRAWRVVTGFARRHPGLSVITFLTSLGLAAEEAVEFLAWGEARSRRRRRRRGISAADMRVTRRTMRRMIRFHSDLRAIAGPGVRGRRRGSTGAITAVSAGS